jgi:hypothetical protein
MEVFAKLLRRVVVESLELFDDRWSDAVKDAEKWHVHPTYLPKPISRLLPSPQFTSSAIRPRVIFIGRSDVIYHGIDYSGPTEALSLRVWHP